MIKSGIIKTIVLLVAWIQMYGQHETDSFNADYFERQRFAHRGGYSNGPENILQTIVENIKNGVTAIEIDVRLTKDDELILFHDETIKRILQSDSDLRVNELSLKKLQSIPLRNTSSGVQHLCTLDELFGELAILRSKNEIGHFLLEIDFKPHASQTEKAVNALNLVLDNHMETFGNELYNVFYVSSFYPKVLKEINRRNPKIVKAFEINNKPDKNKFLANLAILLAPTIVRKYQAKIIEPNMCMITERFVQKWHRRGILINAYTANTACEKAHLENFGIAYTTNCPEGFCQQDLSDQIGKPAKWCKTCR